MYGRATPLTKKLFCRGVVPSIRASFRLSFIRVDEVPQWSLRVICGDDPRGTKFDRTAWTDLGAQSGDRIAFCAEGPFEGVCTP